MNISKIDSNFSSSFNLRQNNKKLLNTDYLLFGGFFCNNHFERICEKEIRFHREQLKELNRNTSGIRICFKTNSRYIMLNAKMPLFNFPMMAESSASGFDAYIKDGDNCYTKVFLQPYEKRDNGDYCSEIDLKNNNEKEVIISFPTYNSPSLVEVFVEKDAVVKAFNPYHKTVCFYGSSITQGCCASRPSNSYPMLLSKKYGFDFFNLGFSGNCRGDLEIAFYIANLDIDALVMEYDHNSSLSELEKNYPKFLCKILEKKPNLPIILMSRSDFHNTEEDLKRSNIIHNVFNDLNLKYKNLYFVDGSKIYEKYDLDLCTVDGTHPNDLGMFCISQNLDKLVDKILNKII